MVVVGGGGGGGIGESGDGLRGGRGRARGPSEEREGGGLKGRLGGRLIGSCVDSCVDNCVSTVNSYMLMIAE